MKILVRVVVALMTASAATPALAQSAPAQQQAQASAETPANVRPSKGALKALAELQAAIKANDLASIPSKIAAAQAVATTKEDKLLLGKLQVQAALATKDSTAMAAALDTLASSGMIDAQQMSRFYTGLGAQLYDAKQFDKAGAAFEKALSLDSGNFDAVVDLGETRFNQGRKAEAVASMQRAIQLKLAAGQKPPEELYKRALGLAYAAQMPQAADLARQWVSAYPSGSSWRDAIAIYRNSNRPDEESSLDLMRLMRATGGMNSSDFAAYLNTLKEQLNFVEAQTALEKSPAIDGSDAQLKQIAGVIMSKPKVTAADLSAAAKSVATGNGLLRVGDRFYGLGEYAKAVETYRAAKAKGLDANLVNERVGVALAASGDKAGATAALKAVTGARAGVAQLWLLYLQNQA
jgi:tetratricopeptide (TPR) repeat protein